MSITRWILTCSKRLWRWFVERAAAACMRRIWGMKCLLLAWMGVKMGGRVVSFDNDNGIKWIACERWWIYKQQSTVYLAEMRALRGGVLFGWGGSRWDIDVRISWWQKIPLWMLCSAAKCGCVLVDGSSKWAAQMRVRIWGQQLLLNFSARQTGTTRDWAL